MSRWIPDRLLIQELFHGVFAIPFAFLVWRKTRSIKRGLLVILLTYAMDADHLVDYFMFYGVIFSIAKFFSGEYFDVTHRAIVPLHAWEWLVVLGILARKRGWKSIFTVLFFAQLPHLIFDSITVGSIPFYSIIYRGLKGFDYLN